MNYIKYLDDNRKIVYTTKDSVEERLFKSNVTFKDIVDCWMIYNNAQEIKEEDWLHLP